MRLATLHDAGNVKRFHTIRTLMTTTVAHHSWGVCLILLTICEPSVNLLKAAIYHDMAESVTGDIPATAKWRSGALSDALTAMEATFDEQYNLSTHLTDEEANLLKWADMFELILYANQEISMGNEAFRAIKERGLNYLNSRTAPTIMAYRLLKEHT